MSRKTGAKPNRNRNKELDSQNSHPQFEMKEQIDRSPIVGKTERQKQYINAIKQFDITFAVGPAGTGKTYICAALAAEALAEKKIDKIIITRPAVEAGEKLGFLPGELNEKFDPYLTPFREILDQRLGRSFVDYLIKVKRIEAAPLAYMRGRTFRNAWVILDEAQNTSPVQMKMFLTRIGENAKLIINGDVDQKDIPGMSGLADAVNRCSWIPKVKKVQFSKSDSVRHDIVQEILQSYETLDPISTEV